MRNEEHLPHSAFIILHSAFLGDFLFPLAGKEFPATSDELAEAIAGALGRVLTLPKTNGAVTAEGGKFPSIKKLKINLNNATDSAADPPPKPRPTGKRQPGIS